MRHVVTKVTVVNQSGEILELDNDTMEFGYRYSIIRNQPFVVTEVMFQLKEGVPEEIKATMDDLAARRREKQPLEYPSAGSYFKRPEGHFAGKLIEDCGLKGTRIGGAAVSQKHAGFLINLGGATAEDVLRLEELVRAQVLSRFGVELEREVRWIR